MYKYCQHCVNVQIGNENIILNILRIPALARALLILC